MSDGYLLTEMASILLSSFKISQLTNVHNYKLQAFLSLPVYFSFCNFENDQLRSYYQHFINYIFVILRPSSLQKFAVLFFLRGRGHLVFKQKIKG